MDFTDGLCISSPSYVGKECDVLTAEGRYQAERIGEGVLIKGEISGIRRIHRENHISK